MNLLYMKVNYILLENVFNFHLKYERMFNEKKFQEKDSDIKTLIKVINENNIKTDIKLNTITNKLDGLYSITQEIASRSVVNPKNEDNIHEYMLLQSKNNANLFKINRGQKKYLSKKEKDFKDTYNKLIREYSPNPINFVDLIKERIKKFNKDEQKIFMKNVNKRMKI